MVTKIPRSMLQDPSVAFSDVRPGDLASQSAAQAGEANNAFMTPLRVAQAIAAQVPAQPPGFDWSNHAAFYTSGRTNAMLATSLPIGGPMRQILRAGPLALTTRDLIIATSQAQFTTNQTHVYNPAVAADLKATGIWSYLVLATSIGDVADPVPPGREFTESSGRNLTPAIHHDTHVKTGILRSPVNSSTHYVAMLARCANPSIPQLDIAVDQDYGHLDVLVLKNFFPA